MQQYLNPAFLKVAIFVLFIVGSMVVSIWRKAAEEKAKREIAERQRRARDEYERTGGLEPQRSRTVSESSPSTTLSLDPANEAKRRLAEMARQRRSELEVLAKRMTGQATQRPPQSPASVRSVTVGGRPTAPAARTPAPRQSKPQKQASKQTSRPSSVAPQSSRTDQFVVAPGGHRHTQADEGESVVHRLVSDTPTTSTATPAAHALAQSLRLRPDGQTISASALSDLRRAIVLGEVLGPPLALRNGNQGHSAQA